MTWGMGTLIWVLAFASAFLCLQVLTGAGRQATLKVRLANDRLRRMQTDDPQTNVLKTILKSRGLNTDGEFAAAAAWMNMLVLHSGLKLGRHGIYFVMLGFSVALALTGYLVKNSFLWFGIGAVAGALLPIFILHKLVLRRRHKAVLQLPEALDVIVRSLGAGHPVPVAMALVAREMPDPIGSEFGIASDEVSFGASMSESIQRLAERVGHEDFELFSAMIRLQERTGGNLGELLASNAKTIRDRQRMRLKVKAASAEGRMSALILNLAPIAIFILLNMFAPQFYGDVEGHPAMKYAFWIVIVWMGIGNMVMRRMINFRI